MRTTLCFYFYIAKLTQIYRDLADAFPNGEFANYFRAEWITLLIKETRANRDYSARTIETARWARAQVKKQTEAGQGGGQIMT